MANGKLFYAMTGYWHASPELREEQMSLYSVRTRRLLCFLTIGINFVYLVIHGPFYFDQDYHR